MDSPKPLKSPEYVFLERLFYELLGWDEKRCEAWVEPWVEDLSEDVFPHMTPHEMASRALLGEKMRGTLSIREANNLEVLIEGAIGREPLDTHPASPDYERVWQRARTRVNEVLAAHGMTLSDLRTR